MLNLINLENRTVMITGASSGIGQASAVYASKLGAQVVLCGRNINRLKSTLEMMNHREQHLIVDFDVNDFEKYDEVFNSILSSAGKLNGLIHCAGSADATPLRAMTYSKIKKIMETNFFSFIMLTSFFSKKKYSNGGSILGISAANAHYPQKYMSIYAASKSAVEASVKSLAVELCEKKIRINCIVPGAVDTPMSNSLPPDILESIKKRHLLGLSSPEQIAEVIMFLLSDAASAITGRTIFADGGRLGQ